MFGPRDRIFEDREHAGRLLAGRLERYADENPLVLALPRGGAPVGYEVARSLGAPLDVLISRKLGAPDQPELAIGAVAPGGLRVLNRRAVRSLGVPEEYLERVTRQELEEAERRTRRFRDGRPEPDVEGRTAILTDDGIATGMTVYATILAVKERNPRRLVLAVPVCAAETAERLRSEVDDFVCLQEPPELGAIGFWYRAFDQTSDEEVVDLLDRARRNVAGDDGGI